MLPKIVTIEDVRKYRANSTEQQKNFQYFEYPLTLLCVKGSSGRSEIPISQAGDFELLGYNISYSLGTANAIDSIKIRFGQTTGNRKWSSDFVSLVNIAVPGPRVPGAPVPRYGMRLFPVWVPRADSITVEWQSLENASTGVDITVDIAMCGIIHFAGRG